MCNHANNRSICEQTIGMELSEAKDHVDAWHLLQELAYNPTPFALHAILELHIPEILSNSGRSLTSAQIAQHLEPRSPDAAHKLERMLRVLAHKGFFTATPGGDPRDPVRFGLTTVSRFFTTRSAYDLSAFARLYRLAELQASWTHLRACVEGDVGAFEVANGTSFWSCASDNAAFGDAFHAAMATAATVKTAVVARCYGGFRDAKKLVDVGGGVGAGVREIVALHPHIVATNFDLPHVVAAAPPIPGVEHVGGNFFKFVPSGDIIIIQHCLHDWGDEECVTILKNCHKALPENGKLVIRDYVIDSPESSAVKTTAALHSDLLMLALFNGRGKERTTKEWESILQAGGFPQFSFLSLEGFDAIEAVKT